jgi:hypothetical protein
MNKDTSSRLIIRGIMIYALFVFISTAYVFARLTRYIEASVDSSNHFWSQQEMLAPFAIVLAAILLLIMIPKTRRIGFILICLGTLFALPAYSIFMLIPSHGITDTASIAEAMLAATNALWAFYGYVVFITCVTAYAIERHWKKANKNQPISGR